MQPDTEKPGPRRRGRPRSFEPQDVLDKVKAVFVEKGFAAASLDDLAAAAGLNRPSLYAAFGDKEGLYIHMLRQTGERIEKALDAALSQPGAIEERLTLIYESAIQSYAAPPVRPGCVIVNTAAAAAPTHPVIGAAAREIRDAMERRFARAFEECAQARLLPADPSPATRAKLATAILDTLAIRARLGAPAEELRALARDSIAQVCSV